MTGSQFEEIISAIVEERGKFRAALAKEPNDSPRYKWEDWNDWLADNFGEQLSALPYRAAEIVEREALARLRAAAAFRP